MTGLGNNILINEEPLTVAFAKREMRFVMKDDSCLNECDFFISFRLIEVAEGNKSRLQGKSHFGPVLSHSPYRREMGQ